jgi:hypothetical protein
MMPISTTTTVSSTRVKPRLFRVILVTIVAAGDVYHDAIFQSQVIHEPAAAMIVGPFFYDHQLFYAIRSSVPVIAIRPHVIIIIVNAVIARVVAESVDPFLLPNLDMIRITAFSQHPGLEIAFRYETEAAPQACRTGIGQR